MNEIKKYVEKLFENAPKKSNELKEELLLDLGEKYTDLINEGKNSNEAYNEIISGIGNIQELLNTNNGSENLDYRKKKALITSLCIGLYILALISVILLESFNMDEAIIVTSFFGIIGLSTCILVYYNMSIPNYNKKDDTMVEEFKEWKNKKNRKQAIRNNISSIIWSSIVIIYFIVSFITNAWYITWVLFIIGGLFEQVASLIINVRGDKNE